MVSKPKLPPEPPPPPNTPTRADPSVQAAGLRTRGSPRGVDTPSTSVIGAAVAAAQGNETRPFESKRGGKRSLIGGS